MSKLARIIAASLVVLCGASMGAEVHTRAAKPLIAVQKDASAAAAIPGTSGCRVPEGHMQQVSDRPGSAAGAAVHLRPAAQVTRSDKADMTFETRQTDDDRVQVAGRSGDLRIVKTVSAQGGLELELSTDKDRVVIVANGSGTTVSRGKTTVVLPRGTTSEEKVDAARRLLADSKAVVRFRRVSAALMEDDDRSGAALAMVIGDAVIGQLTGDVGAARRAAKHLAHNGASKGKPVALRPVCFQTMEADMMYALNDYAACLGSVWGTWPWEDLCAWRWIVEVESVWFQFISCSGLGGIF